MTRRRTAAERWRAVTRQERRRVLHELIFKRDTDKVEAAYWRKRTRAGNAVGADDAAREWEAEAEAFAAAITVLRAAAEPEPEGES